MHKKLEFEGIITERFTIMGEEKYLSEAMSIFDKNKPDIVVVVDKEDNYKGILSERWIYRAMINPTQTKIKSLTIRVPKIYEDASLVDVAKIMLERNIQVVPIFNKKDEVVGIIKDIDLLSKVIETEFGNLNVMNFATLGLIKLSKKDKVSKALAIFRDNNISRAPVVENNEIVGIVTMHDIVTRFIVPRTKATLGEFRGEKLHPLSVPVERIMSHPIIHINLRGKIKQAVKLMRKKDISDVVILTGKRVEGIVTKRDLLEAFVEYSKTPEKKFLIQFAGDYSEIDEIEMEKIKRDLNNLSSKLEKILGGGTMVVHFKVIGTKTGRIRYLIRIRLISPGKTYNVNYECFNALDVMQVLLDKMERIVISDKEEEDEERWRDYFIGRMWL